MRDLRLAFGFFTVIPLPRQTGTMKEAAGSCYLLPLVALATGGIAGIAAWGSASVWNPPVTAALTLALLLLLTGMHHADGLADFGDALMARGGYQRRIEVLKDRTLGVGAAGALLITYLITWSALLEILSVVEGADIIWYLVGAEAAARMTLLLTAMFSTPSHEGSGSVFIVAAKSGRGIFGVVSCLGLLALTVLPAETAAPVLAAVGSLIVAASIAVIGKRYFGGVGGDLLGAAVELGRMAALLAFAASLNAWPPG